MELLSPVGSQEKLIYALAYGADAVYCGGKNFSLRAKATNLTNRQLKWAVDYCHTRAKKIYITVNIFAQNSDVQNLCAFLEFLQSIDVDGVIVSDMGVFSLCKTHCPDVPIFVSTQANVLSTQSAKMWLKLGAKRVILARELSFDEASQIKKSLPDLEVELFVHGAMCIAYSGRCLMSSFLTARSGNRGECSHVCRWDFAVTERKRDGQYFDLDQDSYGSYIMNSKDLCLVEQMHKLHKAQLDSCKIEGRMKSLYYVANTTRVYKRAIALAKAGKKANKALFTELEKVSHRPYTTGFLFPQKGESKQNYSSSSYIKTHQYLGKVIGKKDGFVEVDVRAKFVLGEQIEFIFPNLDDDFFYLVGGILEVKHGKTTAVEKSKPNTTVKLPLTKTIPEFGIIRKKI